MFFLELLLISFILYFTYTKILKYYDHQGYIHKKSSVVMIFDFDGTICDSQKEVFDAFNQLSHVYNFNKLTEAQIELLKNLSSREVIKKLNIPQYKLPFLAKKIHKIIDSKILQMKPFDGIKEVLLELESKGVTLGILTSNSTINVIKFLKHHDINCFNFIHSSTSFFGKDKAIKKISKKLNSDNIFYIGDETRDIIAAKKANIIAVAVSWGYNNVPTLLNEGPSYLINHPKKLKDLMNYNIDATAP